MRRQVWLGTVLLIWWLQSPSYHCSERYNTCCFRSISDSVRLPWFSQDLNFPFPLLSVCFSTWALVPAVFMAAFPGRKPGLLDPEDSWSPFRPWAGPHGGAACWPVQTPSFHCWDTSAPCASCWVPVGVLWLSGPPVPPFLCTGADSVHITVALIPPTHLGVRGGTLPASLVVEVVRGLQFLAALVGIWGRLKNKNQQHWPHCRVPEVYAVYHGYFVLGASLKFLFLAGHLFMFETALKREVEFFLCVC